MQRTQEVIDRLEGLQYSVRQDGRKAATAIQVLTSGTGEHDEESDDQWAISIYVQVIVLFLLLVYFVIFWLRSKKAAVLFSKAEARRLQVIRQEVGRLTVDVKQLVALVAYLAELNRLISVERGGDGGAMPTATASESAHRLHQMDLDIREESLRRDPGASNRFFQVWKGRILFDVLFS